VETSPASLFRTPSPYIWINNSTSATIAMKKLKGQPLDNYGVIVSVNSVIRFQGARSDLPFMMNTHLTPGTHNFVSLKWDMPNSWRSLEVEFEMPKLEEEGNGSGLPGERNGPIGGKILDKIKEHDSDSRKGVGSSAQKYKQSSEKTKPHLRKESTEESTKINTPAPVKGAWSWFTSFFS